MQLRFDPIVASEASRLGNSLSASEWPFHVEQLEAQHGRAWGAAGARPVDAVGYAILREDAEAP